MNSKQVYTNAIYRVQLNRVQSEADFVSCVINVSLCLHHTDDQPVSVHTQVLHNIITHTHTHSEFTFFRSSHVCLCHHFQIYQLLPVQT